MMLHWNCQPQPLSIDMKYGSNRRPCLGWSRSKAMYRKRSLFSRSATTVQTTSVPHVESQQTVKTCTFFINSSQWMCSGWRSIQRCSNDPLPDNVAAIQISSKAAPSLFAVFGMTQSAECPQPKRATVGTQTQRRNCEKKKIVLSYVPVLLAPSHHSQITLPLFHLRQTTYGTQRLAYTQFSVFCRFSCVSFLEAVSLCMNVSCLSLNLFVL